MECFNKENDSFVSWRCLRVRASMEMLALQNQHGRVFNLCARGSAMVLVSSDSFCGWRKNHEFVLKKISHPIGCWTLQKFFLVSYIQIIPPWKNNLRE